mgnify:CR=1 FL=1
MACHLHYDEKDAEKNLYSMFSNLPQIEVDSQSLTYHPPQQLGILADAKFLIYHLLLGLHRPIAFAKVIGNLLVAVTFAKLLGNPHFFL